MIGKIPLARLSEFVNSDDFCGVNGVRGDSDGIQISEILRLLHLLQSNSYKI